MKARPNQSDYPRSHTDRVPGRTSLAGRLTASLETKAWLNVELTNVCDLHCPLCITGTGRNPEPQGFMDFDAYRTWLRAVAPRVEAVRFLGNGEPTLHPRFLDFIAETAALGLPVQVGTNGMHLPPAKALLASGLSALYLDVDGVTPEQHSLYRRGAELTHILSSAKSLAAARPGRRPELYFLTLLGRHNEEQRPQFLELARTTGMDGIVFQLLADEFYAQEGQTSSRWFGRRHERLAEQDCVWRSSLGMLNWRGELQLCQMGPYKQGCFTKHHAFANPDPLVTLHSAEFRDLTNRCGSFPFCRGCQCRSFERLSETVLFSKRLFLRKGLEKLLRNPGVYLLPSRLFSMLRQYRWDRS